MMTNTIDEVIELRSKKEYIKAKEKMEDILSKDPNNAYYNYQMAWCLDNLGLEHEAIHYYHKSINNNLELIYLKDAYIGLGSTYRSIGKFKEAEHILNEGLTKFDDSPVLKIFLAITQYNMNNNQKSVSLLIDTLLTNVENTEIHEYKNALKFYNENLDKIFN
ncbi:tetratricopeptide repeat protein [Mammaliicoccus sciuri]|uniref:tetratricopeptide repeat protein n=2 Tax=Mammaliicoccus sciuri TaxID=1296 RepID=UPI001A97EF09|nr:tetratricopeptide repeat protein [Mammaliicoccus sciuri]MBO1218079.1 tetratricopeptide repeat protein [Mammaliicoccus sciuri]